MKMQQLKKSKMAQHMSTSQGNIPKLVKDINRQNFFTGQISSGNLREE